MTNEACENTFEVQGAGRGRGVGGGGRLQETLQVFVLELIEPIRGPDFVMEGHLHAPNPTEGETADEFV